MFCVKKGCEIKPSIADKYPILCYSKYSLRQVQCWLAPNKLFLRSRQRHYLNLLRFTVLIVDLSERVVVGQLAS